VSVIGNLNKLRSQYFPLKPNKNASYSRNLIIKKRNKRLLEVAKKAVEITVEKNEKDVLFPIT